MRSRIEALARHKEMQKNRVVIDYSEYNAAAANRLDLPGYVLFRIYECVDEIKAKYPIVKSIKLIGSYSKGTYIDEQTSIEFIALKEGVGARVKISDFDFETTPLLVDLFTTKNGHKVHLWVPNNKNEGSLTWKFN